MTIFIILNYLTFSAFAIVSIILDGISFFDNLIKFSNIVLGDSPIEIAAYNANTVNY